MGLDSIIRSVVSIAKTVTSTLQTTVTWEAWIGSSGGYGASVYATGVSLNALVERKHKLIRSSPAGEFRETQAVIVLLEPVTPNGATGRTEPIDLRDKFTLADGTTGPILKTEGLIDRSTGRPYLTEIWLGVRD